MLRRAARKVLTILLTFSAVTTARGAEAQAYDLFGRALAPIAAAVLGSPDGRGGAMVAECLVKNSTGALSPAAGTRLRIAVQSPDRFRLDIVRQRDSRPLTACRDGKELWAMPAEPMTALAQAAGLDTEKNDPDTTVTPLLPLALNAQMLTFLPLAFDVKDLGREENCRVLEFGLLPALRDTIKTDDFTGRAWIGEDDRPTRLVLVTAGGTIDLEIEKIDFADQLANSAWQPSNGEPALRLPASALNGLFEKMLGGAAD